MCVVMRSDLPDVVCLDPVVTFTLFWGVLFLWILGKFGNSGCKWQECKGMALEQRWNLTTLIATACHMCSSLLTSPMATGFCVCSPADTRSVKVVRVPRKQLANQD